MVPVDEEITVRVSLRESGRRVTAFGRVIAIELGRGDHPDRLIVDWGFGTSSELPTNLVAAPPLVPRRAR